MTQPVAAPGAPEGTETATTEPVAAPPAAGVVPEAPVEAAPAAQVDPQTVEPWADPDRARSEIEKLRKENAAARVNAKKQAADEARQELLKQLGLVQSDEAAPVDPEKLAADLTSERASHADTAARLAVYEAAGQDYDVSVLLDSVSFRAKLQEIDLSDGVALQAAIGEAAVANPALARRLPAPRAAQGATGAPESTESRIAKARAAGDHKTAAALKTEQLLQLREQLN